MSPLDALIAAGSDPETAGRLLAALRHAGFTLADDRAHEFVCRWIDVQNVAVPPDADTIIRTITTTTNGHSTSTTHWLEGLKPPPR